MSLSKIKLVEKGSISEKAGVQAGETLLRVNGHEINDVLDYMYHTANKSLILELSDSSGQTRTVRIKNPLYKPLGLEFENYLMDKARSCANNCVFCFIDQLPGGLRDTLYFKDDDMRLSFLTGNYITLTNLSDHDIERIAALKISPVNISVHTTNPELRCKMLRNKNAGTCFTRMQTLASAGVSMNCQIVVVPGLNDGDALLSSMRDLYELHPAVNSVSVVPVGLTKYRENLPDLRAVNAADAAAIIDMTDSFTAVCLKESGSRVVYCADELYLKAGRTIPDYSYYEDFPQYENGVGMLRALEDEFMTALEDLNGDFNASFSVATGVAASSAIKKLLQKLQEKCYNIKGRVYPVENAFFGHSVTVAGLITGGDLIARLADEQLGDYLLIPSAMLRHEGDLFLDGVSLNDVERALKLPVYPVPNDGAKLLEAFTSRH